MCGRYQVESDWDDFPDFYIPEDFTPNSDLRPTDPAPVFRLDQAAGFVSEIRRWGFLRTWPGQSGKWVKRQLFNAVGEELEQKRAFRDAYASARCLVPMNAWYEWPIIDGKKTKVRIAMQGRRMFAAAGLYETSKSLDDGKPVETFTIVTVPPNELLGTVHDRAPLVLRPEDYMTWLEGGVLAQSLITAHPDPNAFSVEAVKPAVQQSSFGF
jgi:putative SOS response-associated peptidase YedK